MRPRYYAFVGTTPQVIPLDTNIKVFNVSIKVPAGTPTVEVCLEAPADSIGSGTYNPGIPNSTPVWVAAPAAVNGIVVLKDPVAAVRITPSAGGVATVLQQGI